MVAARYALTTPLARGFQRPCISSLDALFAMLKRRLNARSRVSVIHPSHANATSAESTRHALNSLQKPSAPQGFYEQK